MYPTDKYALKSIRNTIVNLQVRYENTQAEDLLFDLWQNVENLTRYMTENNIRPTDPDHPINSP